MTGPSPGTDIRVLATDARELLDPELRVFVDELEELGDRHGRRLSLRGLVGSVELSFSPHGLANLRLALFLKPSLRLRKRRGATAPSPDVGVADRSS